MRREGYAEIAGPTTSVSTARACCAPVAVGADAQAEPRRAVQAAFGPNDISEIYLPTASPGQMIAHERPAPRSPGSQNDWQHAGVWRAHPPGILPTMPLREDRQRRQMAGPNAGADAWIADGMYELWWRGSRRPTELEGAAGAGDADRGAMAKLRTATAV
jgi:hypothetical protein